MNARPLVVVLILSYNGKSLLYDALTSYLSSEYSNLKIILIDNGSEDKTEEYVLKSFPLVEVLRLNKNKGYSGGFNAGILYAKNKYNPDYFLISNNDVFIHKNAISELVSVALSSSEIGFVTGKVYYYNFKGRKDVLQTVGKEFSKNTLIPKNIGSGEIDRGQYDHIESLQACDDVYSLVSKGVIESTNGYDGNFFHEHEETDWHFRSKKLGFKISFSSRSKLWHKLSVTTGGWLTPKIVFYSFRNQILILKRHGTENQLLIFLMKLLFWRLPVNIFINFIKSRFNLLTASFKGTLSGFKWIIEEDYEVIQ